MTVRFEDAWVQCAEILRTQRQDALKAFEKVVLVRDLFGRLHLALQPAPKADLQPLIELLARAAGPFWSGHVFDSESMVAPEVVFDSPDAFEIGERLVAIERVAVGADWGRGPLENQAPQPPRAVLYGLKGGVGRSTALSVWARHLASSGRRVLVVDLDLESPGVSSLLLPPGAGADFGVVDWFVEDAVGNADAELLQLMVAPSPLADGTRGQVLVAPCAGTSGRDYLSKLSRAYIDVPGRPRGTFGERLAVLLDELERQHLPDVVLLDSRAGLHDLAAVATTRLGAMTFLFGTNARQTWNGYRSLFASWARHPPIAQEVRDRLRVVAAQIPETGRVAYLETLRERAYEAFADTLYEEVGADLGAFNFDIEASDAPHDPIKVYWSRAFQEWDPATDSVPPEQVEASFSDFLNRATELILPRTLPGQGAP